MTPETKATLEAVKAFYALHGMAPTIRELGKLRGNKSTQAIHTQVRLLIEQGHLRRIPGKARNMAPVDLLARYSTEELRAEIERRSADNG